MIVARKALEEGSGTLAGIGPIVTPSKLLKLSSNAEYDTLPVVEVESKIKPESVVLDGSSKGKSETFQAIVV